MTLQTAIAKADELRPNAVNDEHKAQWVAELDGEIAEMMERQPQLFNYPEDIELLMPAPHDYIYVYYLCAMIDQASEDTTLYANDAVVANMAISNAKAWWRRHHMPSDTGRVRGLW